MVEFIQIDTGKLIDLWQRAIDACPEGKRVSNLILTGTFQIAELDADWLLPYKTKAQKWQSNPAPRDIEFSHGQFIEPYTESLGIAGVDFLIAELKQKGDSNRACWSLLNMNDLVKSEVDRSIPSFMILQVGLSDDNKLLEVCAYYRALEVHKFLPINIAESCLVAKKINEAFGFGISNISLTIHAFNAYNDPEFSCLEKALIDTQTEMFIMSEINFPKTGKTWMKGMLSQKRDLKESRINPFGIAKLIEAIIIHNDKNKMTQVETYPDTVLGPLEEIFANIELYNKYRAISSYSKESKDIYQQIKAKLGKVIENL